MAKDNKVNLPSGMGGLVRYFDDYKSRIQIKPGAVIIIAIVVVVVIALLHRVGSSWLGF